MDRTTARKLARRMAKSGQFNYVEVIEDFTHPENGCRIQAQNRCWMPRSAATEVEVAELLRETR